MTAKEAKELLSETPFNIDNAPAACNPGLSRANAVKIILAYIDTLPGDTVLDELFEKRVLQVTRNQRRPKF